MPTSAKTRVTKVVTAAVRKVDAAAGTVEAVLSTEAVDRDGDIIRQAGWDLKHFNAHPVLLSSHDYSSLQSIIGEWRDVRVEGKQLVGTAHYYRNEGNREADWGFTLASKGQAAYSVGFIPDMDKAVALKDSEGFFPHYEYNGQELLEVSQVSIPSNPEALQRMFSSTSRSAGHASSEGHPLARAVRRAVAAAIVDAQALRERRRRNVAKLLGYSDPKWLRPGQAEAMVEYFRVQGQPGRFDD